MHWVLYLVLASGASYPYHENGVVKVFKTKADCTKVQKFEAKDLTGPEGMLYGSGKVYGKDFTLVCKQGKA